VAIKLKIAPKPASDRRPAARAASHSSGGLLKIAIAAGILIFVAVFGLFAFYYVKYEKIIDRRMSGQIFTPSARIYALPHTVRVGQTIEAQEIASDLRRAGYSEQGKGNESQIGTFRLIDGGIQVSPGPESYHEQDTARIEISGGQVQRITANKGADVTAYELEPQLVTALFNGEERAKRQLVHYDQIPPTMVKAVLAIEDRRFFTHSGINYFRLGEAAFADLRSGGKRQGASTITMQVSRAFFLNRQKTYGRKIVEMLIAFQLEQRFTKQQIFELYANEVDMGQRGSFSTVGFSEAARAYFNKDLQSLNLPEAALLAGLIQAPSALSPYRHPERAMERRNLVLDAMVETGAITRDQAEQAKAVPLKLAPPNVEASDAPYFVDLVREQLSAKYSDMNESGLHIYTTIDPDLQRAAAEAVQTGIQQVDEMIDRRRTKKTKTGTGKDAKVETTVAPGPQAQVALVALDPHTGDVLALVGGRNYGMSQLNHAVAKRPTGSIFKPFVYATAVNTALAGSENPTTPVSMIDDSPTTFSYEDKVYEPRNYKDEYHGMVTARYALAESLNNATVKLAESVGYDTVASLARAAGIASVKATPAMALGAYDATPLEMAGAYTVFANQGVRVSPTMVRSVHDAKGEVLEDFNSDSKRVLDPRVAYVMTGMMQGVLNFGTGYTVRQRGFDLPAAGKTGTSHDAWFAGYTSNLLCIVWVGFDDYSDLKLAGGATAAPIWAEFMKRAVKLPDYRDAHNFIQPEGIVNVQLDKNTNLLVTPACSDQTYTAAFIAGTEPKDTCEQGNDHRNFLQKLLGIGSPAPSPALPPPTLPQSVQQRSMSGAQSSPPPAPSGTEPEKKKGLFGKIVGIFKDDNNQQSQPRNPKP
jgi:penicillin-binding protein 1B